MGICSSLLINLNYSSFHSYVKIYNILPKYKTKRMVETLKMLLEINTRVCWVRGNSCDQVNLISAIQISILVLNRQARSKLKTLNMSTLILCPTWFFLLWQASTILNFILLLKSILKREISSAKLKYMHFSS